MSAITAVNASFNDGVSIAVNSPRSNENLESKTNKLKNSTQTSLMEEFEDRAHDRLSASIDPVTSSGLQIVQFNLQKKSTEAPKQRKSGNVKYQSVNVRHKLNHTIQDGAPSRSLINV